MSEIIDITPSAITDTDLDAKPVKIKYGSVAMQLPRLDDSRQLPIEILTAGLSVTARGWDNLTKDEQIGVLAVFLAYLQREYPRLSRELDKSGDKIKDIGLIIQAWGAWEDTDPKA